MSKEKSLALFRTPPRNCNCAQTIAVGFGREDLFAEFASCGGGRASDGLCGAIYAATRLAPESARAAMIEAFRAKNGSALCRELKRDFRVPCPQCVATAAELLEDATKASA